jgi:hypothetical protein
LDVLISEYLGADGSVKIETVVLYLSPSSDVNMTGESMDAHDQLGALVDLLSWCTGAVGFLPASISD